MNMKRYSMKQNRYHQRGRGLAPIYGLSALLWALFSLGGCSDGEEALPLTSAPVQLLSSIEAFSGEEPATRVNAEGNAFQMGDRMRLKIICPFVTSTETGEGNSYAFDAFWLNKWTGSGWTNLTEADGCDINGDGKLSRAYDVQSLYLSQATPYVFTASTWSQEVVFRTKENKTVVQYQPVFRANQSTEANYLESDLLWAQTVMQTATDQVQLHFQHVMCALSITLEGFSLTALDEVTLTVDGMPDIDGAEVIVGDYYAEKSKANSSNFGYKAKNHCDYAHNGQVLGIGVNDYSQNKGYTQPMKGNVTASTYSGGLVPNTGSYTAWRQTDNLFRLIVPPCELDARPVVWLRSGEQRWKSTLEQTRFEQGCLYKLKVSLPPTPAEPDPGSEPDPNPENQ